MAKPIQYCKVKNNNNNNNNFFKEQKKKKNTPAKQETLVQFLGLEDPLEKVWRKGNSLTLLVGMQSNTATKGNSLEIP